MASSVPNHIYQFFLHSHEMKGWSGPVFRLARQTWLKENVTGQIFHAVVTRPDGYSILTKAVDTVILLGVFKVAETVLLNREEQKKAEEREERVKLSKIHAGPFADILNVAYPKGLTLLEKSMFLTLFQNLSRLHRAVKITKRTLKPSLKQIVAILNNNSSVTTARLAPIADINWRHINRNVGDMYDVIPEWEVEKGVRLHLEDLKKKADKNKPKLPPVSKKERPRGWNRNKRF
jgi:hypothetical protein